MLRPIRRRRLRRNSLPAGATRLAAGKLQKATNLWLVAFDSLGGASRNCGEKQRVVSGLPKWRLSCCPLRFSIGSGENPAIVEIVAYGDASDCDPSASPFRTGVFAIPGMSGLH